MRLPRVWITAVCPICGRQYDYIKGAKRGPALVDMILARTKGSSMPEFATEEQEAEYWNTHSPLDVAIEPKPQEVRVKKIKDRPITIRLDSESYLELAKLAAQHKLGPSTFARIILLRTIEQAKQSISRGLSTWDFDKGGR